MKKLKISGMIAILVSTTIIGSIYTTTNAKSRGRTQIQYEQNLEDEYQDNMEYEYSKIAQEMRIKKENLKKIQEQAKKELEKENIKDSEKDWENAWENAALSSIKTNTKKESNQENKDNTKNETIEQEIKVRIHKSKEEKLKEAEDTLIQLVDFSDLDEKIKTSKQECDESKHKYEIANKKADEAIKNTLKVSYNTNPKEHDRLQAIETNLESIAIDCFNKMELKNFEHKELIKNIEKEKKDILKAKGITVKYEDLKANIIKVKLENLMEDEIEDYKKQFEMFNTYINNKGTNQENTTFEKYQKLLTKWQSHYDGLEKLIVDYVKQLNELKSKVKENTKVNFDKELELNLQNSKLEYEEAEDFVRKISLIQEKFYDGDSEAYNKYGKDFEILNQRKKLMTLYYDHMLLKVGETDEIKSVFIDCFYYITD